MTQPTGPVLPAPLDCAVFTPIGAVAKIIGPDDDASCTERGRHEVDEVLGRIERAVLTAHGTGRIAVAFGVPMLQQRIAQRIATIRREPAASASGTPDVAWPSEATHSGGPEATHYGPDTILEPMPHDAPEAAGLAIPGYDTLSASQVVERLDGLSASDLDAVRRYESANRNRRTILGKLDQLRATG